jgi:hypothetical protein
LENTPTDAPAETFTVARPVEPEFVCKAAPDLTAVTPTRLIIMHRIINQIDH